MTGLFTALKDRENVAFQRASLLIGQYIKDTVSHRSKGLAYLLPIIKYGGPLVPCSCLLAQHTEYADVTQPSLSYAVECGGLRELVQKVMILWLLPLL